jgi:hypothetical protein
MFIGSGISMYSHIFIVKFIQVNHDNVIPNEYKISMVLEVFDWVAYFGHVIANVNGLYTLSIATFGCMLINTPIKEHLSFH